MIHSIQVIGQELLCPSATGSKERKQLKLRRRRCRSSSTLTTFTIRFSTSRNRNMNTRTSCKFVTRLQHLDVTFLHQVCHNTFLMQGSYATVQISYSHEFKITGSRNV